MTVRDDDETINFIQKIYKVSKGEIKNSKFLTETNTKGNSY